jgi:hypothetical protein
LVFVSVALTASVLVHLRSASHWELAKEDVTVSTWEGWLVSRWASEMVWKTVYAKALGWVARSGVPLVEMLGRV